MIMFIMEQLRRTAEITDETACNENRKGHREQIIGICLRGLSVFSQRYLLLNIC